MTPTSDPLPDMFSNEKPWPIPTQQTITEVHSRYLSIFSNFNTARQYNHSAGDLCEFYPHLQHPVEHANAFTLLDAPKLETRRAYTPVYAQDPEPRQCHDRAVALSTTAESFTGTEPGHIDSNTVKRGSTQDSPMKVAICPQKSFVAAKVKQEPFEGALSDAVDNSLLSKSAMAPKYQLGDAEMPKPIRRWMWQRKPNAQTRFFLWLELPSSSLQVAVQETCVNSHHSGL